MASDKEIAGEGHETETEDQSAPNAALICINVTLCEYHPTKTMAPSSIDNAPETIASLLKGERIMLENVVMG